MSNQLLTSNIVSKEVLAILENTCGFMGKVNREWEHEFTGNMNRGYEPGSTINIRLPSRYTWRAGRVAVPQASVDGTIPLTLSQGGVDLAFTAAERTLSISSEHIQKKLMAAVATVTSEIDRQGLAMAKFATYNLLNAAGALPATQLAATQVLADVNTRLDIMSAPVKDGNRHMVMGPVLNGAIVPGMAGLFNPQGAISSQTKSGYLADSFGLNPFMDQTVSTHTNGAATATNIAGAGQTGSTITVVAVAAGTLTKGTIINLPGVNSVNAQTREDTGIAMDFVVTADVAQGATSIPVSPPLVTSGAYQNVTGSPTNTTPYVIRGAANTSYKTNIGFHSDAFTLAMVPMWKPMDGMGARVSQKSHKGITIKVTDFYDGVNDNGVMRLDVLFGWAATYPQLATRYYTTS